MRNYLFVLLVVFIIFNSSFAGNPVISIPITFSDGEHSRTIYFGLDPSAADSINLILGEKEQPPISPIGSFDFRFVGTNINIPIGLGLQKDFRAGDSLTTTDIIHELSFQSPTDTLAFLIWSFPSFIKVRLQDVIDGSIIDTTIRDTGSYRIINPSTINKLKFIVSYNPDANPVTPILDLPINYSTNQSRRLVLSWMKTTYARTYHLQLASDSLFSSLYLDDSTLVDTFWQPDSLEPVTTFFWRLRAKNLGLPSEWSDFRSFTTNNEAVPIQLFSFIATVVYGNCVLLEWTTISEVNNFGFIVERRSAGDSLYSIIPNGNISGNGTTLEPQSYSCIDSNLSAGKYYYRLKQIDLDGTETIFNEIEITISKLLNVDDSQKIERDFQLFDNYPNPFNPTTEIRYTIASVGG